METTRETKILRNFNVVQEGQSLSQDGKGIQFNSAVCPLGIGFRDMKDARMKAVVNPSSAVSENHWSRQCVVGKFLQGGSLSVAGKVKLRLQCH